MLVQPGIHTTTGSWTPLLSTTLEQYPLVITSMALV